MSRLFQVLYFLHFTPWERADPPPELVELVEGEDALPPGKALDLGCGTGAQAVYLASKGWEVTGVDIVGRAIRSARKRARKAGAHVRFIEGDVTRTRELKVGEGYSLILDIGCLHSIPRERREDYAAGVEAAATSGARLLSMAFQRSERGPLPPGVDDADFAALFPGWAVVWKHGDPGEAGIGPMKNAKPTWRLLRRSQ